LKVAVVGPGAIGAAFAAAALDAGNDVTLCGRTPLERIEVEYQDGSASAALGPVLVEPSSLDVDWVLLAVKAHQTAGAADWLRALCRDGAVLATLQNGVEQRAWSEPFTGGAPIVPTIVWAPVEPRDRAHMIVRGPTALTVADDAVWVTNSADATVTGIDEASTGTVTVRVGQAPLGLVAIDDAVVVTISGESSVTRLDLGSAP
jgi:ketopantoate reductase